MFKGSTLPALCCALSGFLPMSALAQHETETRNMRLVGYSDLQGRAAYQPFVQKQGERWIAYIGSQNGGPPRLNPLTGKVEINATSIVDVTDPENPQYIAHIPGGGGGNKGELLLGQREGGGGQHLRVCSGDDLPHGEKGKFYLLRDFGTAAWEMWDVTDPANPTKLSDVLSGLSYAHRSFWECDTGIAYVAAGLVGWPAPPAYVQDPSSHIVIYDLSNPAKPVLIRHFGLPGQNPGSTTPYPRSGLYNIISTGPKGNRLYITYGNDSDGIVLIVDREKLLKGPREPTDENLRYPVIARIDLPAHMGAHTALPLPRVPIPEFARQAEGKVQDFLVLVPQQNGRECTDMNAAGADELLDRGHRAPIVRQLVRMFDITDESKPVGVSTWTVREASGNFCSRGGRFGPHSSQEQLGPPYYGRVLFVTFYNAGVRAIDIRDPYHPKEIGYYIPTINKFTEERCVGRGDSKRCKRAIQTNNVTTDERGYIYIVDHASSGMHILELTGAAREVADFTGKAATGGKIIRLQPALDEIVPSGAKVEELATGFKSPEGPLWIRNGGYLLFSDLVENVIRKWNPVDGKVAIFLERSGFTGDDPTKVLDGRGRVGSNGITADREGRIVFCARGDRQVVRLERDGRRTVLVSHYEGKRLNSCNDLVYKSDGALYFTDPDPFSPNYPTKEIPFNGIYRLEDGKLQLLVRDQEYPNGLAFSPDEKFLYVANTRKNTVLRYDVQPDGTLANRRIFVDMSSAEGSGHPDGIKVDRKGNVYSRGPGGIWILSAEGEHLGTIVPPEEIRNLAFGDADGRTLYLASFTGLYRIRLKVPGILP